MGKITLVLGGVRSGKSKFAESLVPERAERVAFVATAQELDDETAERIKRQRLRRPGTWRTFEQPLGLDRLVEQIEERFELILVDCACLYVLNLLRTEEQESNKEGYVLREIENFCRACRNAKAQIIIVSSETGTGVRPQERESRLYRDILGLANQRLAALADEVYLVVAGLPTRLKGEHKRRAKREA